MNRTQAILTCAAAATLASCAQAPADDVHSTSSAVRGDFFNTIHSFPLPLRISTIDCPIFSCGANAATMGDIVFGELNASGAPNDQGVRFDGTGDLRGRRVQLVVQHDELKAVALDDPSAVFMDIGLEGLTFKLNHEDQVFEVTLEEAHRKLVFWVGPMDGVPSYVFSVKALTGPDRQVYPLCPVTFPVGEGWTDSERHALIFKGDHYEARTKKVNPTAPDDPRFNLACAGSAPAKLHLLRHTEAGAYSAGVPMFPTSREQRQAMLKMLTADYCGTGRSFTVDGQPLFYRDEMGRYPWVFTTLGWFPTEAYWGTDGPLCLNKPRIFEREQVMEECRSLGITREIPKCTESSKPPPGWLAYSALRP
jgi:hypothetical protein